MSEMIDLAPDLQLPLDFATARVSLVGMSGAGKSNALAVMIEQCFLHGIPFTHVDPLGAAWGLRSSADGKGAGIAVPIFGGYHGDLPLRSDAGALIAHELYELDVSAVLDLSAFDPEEQTTFTKDLALAMLRLHQRKKKVRSLFVDEAATLAPERKNSTADNDCAVALWRVHTGGRALGIGLKTATQSSADQDKRTMKQSEIFVALRTASPLDQAPVLKYVKTSVDKLRAEQIAKTLASLNDGEAWFIAPRWLGEVQRSRFALRTTFDSSRTPRVGEAIDPPKQLASVDLERLRAALAVVEMPNTSNVGDSASAIEPLRLRIRDLDAQLGRTRSERDHVNDIVASMASAFRLVLSTAQAVLDGLDKEAAEIAPVAPEQGVVAHNAPVKVQKEAAAGTARRRSKARTASALPWSQPILAADGLSAGGSRVLNAAIGRYPLRLTLTNLALFSGWKRSSGPFRIALKELRALGHLLVAYDGTITLVKPPRDRQTLTAAERLEAIRSALKPHELAYFDLLIDKPKQGLSIDELEAATGHKRNSGPFRIALKALRENDLARLENGVYHINGDLLG